ncbi:MAG: hypothetical protein IKU44_04500 [Firmicutes bacterium]|nr:hypothetical protein [Bacillota bacterium]
MLYSLLVAVVILSIFNAVVVPYMAVRYFIKGYNIHAEKPILEPKMPKISRKQKRDEDRNARILSNIDNYTGDETGQVYVK